jgi:hypothetical protein
MGKADAQKKLKNKRTQKEDAFLTDSEFLSLFHGHAHLKASHFTEIQEYKNLFSQAYHCRLFL